MHGRPVHVSCRAYLDKLLVICSVSISIRILPLAIVTICTQDCALGLRMAAHAYASHGCSVLNTRFHPDWNQARHAVRQVAVMINETVLAQWPPPLPTTGSTNRM
jgi:hypothetical protein